MAEDKELQEMMDGTKVDLHAPAGLLVDKDFMGIWEILLKLQQQKLQLLEVLQDLVDLQAGPPFIQHKDAWTATMDKAHELLRQYQGENRT